MPELKMQFRTSPRSVVIKPQMVMCSGISQDHSLLDQLVVGNLLQQRRLTLDGFREHAVEH